MHVTLIQLQNDLLVAKPVQDTTRNEDFDELEHSSSLVFTPEFANVVNVDGLRIKDGKVLQASYHTLFAISQQLS